ncbi:hypothetical protein [Nocardia sp. MW-W600-9]
MPDDMVHEGTDPPKMIGNGGCVVCENDCTTAIAVHGPGDWQVLVLIRLGWTYEQAMIVVSRETGCTSVLDSGFQYVTVSDTPVVLVFGLCAECGKRNDHSVVGDIASGKIPLYTKADTVK